MPNTNYYYFTEQPYTGYDPALQEQYPRFAPEAAQHATSIPRSPASSTTATTTSIRWPTTWASTAS